MEMSSSGLMISRPLVAMRADSSVFIGVDLGKRENYTAIVVLERFEVRPNYTDMLRGVGMR